MCDQLIFSDQHDDSTAHINEILFNGLLTEIVIEFLSTLSWNFVSVEIYPLVYLALSYCV